MSRGLVVGKAAMISCSRCREDHGEPRGGPRASDSCQSGVGMASSPGEKKVGQDAAGTSPRATRRRSPVAEGAPMPQRLDSRASARTRLFVAVGQTPALSSNALLERAASTRADDQEGARGDIFPC